MSEEGERFAKRLAQQTRTTRAMLEEQRWKNFVAEHEAQMEAAAAGGFSHITLPSRLFVENDWLEALLQSKGFRVGNRFCPERAVSWAYHM